MFRGRSVGSGGDAGWHGRGTGYATPDDEAAGSAGREDAPDPATMKIQDIKHWLTTHEHEQLVWQGMQSKAKKAQWVEIMRSVL